MTYPATTAELSAITAELSFPAEPARRRLLRRIAGALCLCLGAAVLTGWYTHNFLLLRVSPAFVAMAYNTALGFFLGGLGLLASASSRRPARIGAWIGGGGAALIGLLTLGEYGLHVRFGIDELLMRSYVRSGITAPGRMAFCTALCFSLCGLSLLLGQGRRFPARPALLSALASAVIGLGLVALSGYLAGIAQSYAWGQLTRMAVHTAAGFVWLGVGLLTLAMRDEQASDKEPASDKEQARNAPGWLPVFAGTTAASVTLCLWQALVVEESAQAALVRRLIASSRLPPPSADAFQPLIPVGALIGGLLLALLLAGAVFLAQTARQQAKELRLVRDGLEQRVAERTEALAQANTALEEVSGWQRSFLRDALANVTDGKLLLCSEAGDLPPLRGSLHGGAIALTPQGGLRDLRCRAVAAAEAGRFSEERVHDLVTAANEAGMNAIVHAGEGMALIGLDSSGTIQIRVEDAGQGISLENLPRAALSRGFTTAGTLGHGLKMMLQAADRLWLLTGPTGTIVVLEQDRLAPEPAWSSR